MHGEKNGTCSSISTRIHTSHDASAMSATCSSTPTSPSTLMMKQHHGSAVATTAQSIIPRRLRTSVYFGLFLVLFIAGLRNNRMPLSISPSSSSSLRDARRNSSVSTPLYNYDDGDINMSAAAVAATTTEDETTLILTDNAADHSNPSAPQHLVQNAFEQTTERSVPGTIAHYICNDLHDPMQMHKIRGLHRLFRDKLYVITDQTDIDADYAAVVPLSQIVGPDHQAVTQGNGNYTNPKVCCGTERSMMWLIDHPDLYEYAWIIEDDVYWTDFNDLIDLVQLYQTDPTDLIDQYLVGIPPFYGDRQSDNWPHYRLLRAPHVQPEAAFDYPLYRALFNLYRVSRRTVAALDDWRVHRNGGQWTFFEALVETVVMRDAHLTRSSLRANALGIPIHLAWRPCLTKSDIYNKWGGRGIFHPVKKDFAFCEHRHLTTRF